MAKTVGRAIPDINNLQSKEPERHPYALLSNQKQPDPVSALPNPCHFCLGTINFFIEIKNTYASLKSVNTLKKKKETTMNYDPATVFIILGRLINSIKVTFLILLIQHTIH